MASAGLSPPERARDVHADIAGRAREDRADGEADRLVDAEEVAEDDRDHDADDADGRVLAVEIGLRPFLHRARDLLHARIAGACSQHLARRHGAIDERQNAARDHDPISLSHCPVPVQTSKSARKMPDQSGEGKPCLPCLR